MHECKCGTVFQGNKNTIVIDVKGWTEQQVRVLKLLIELVKESKKENV
jgi:hypothetical protein